MTKPVGYLQFSNLINKMGIANLHASSRKGVLTDSYVYKSVSFFLFSFYIFLLCVFFSCCLLQLISIFCCNQVALPSCINIDCRLYYDAESIKTEGTYLRFLQHDLNLWFREIFIFFLLSLCVFPSSAIFNFLNTPSSELLHGCNHCTSIRTIFMIIQKQTILQNTCTYFCYWYNKAFHLITLIHLWRSKHYKPFSSSITWSVQL